jgi:hypothetical protein
MQRKKADAKATTPPAAESPDEEFRSMATLEDGDGVLTVNVELTGAEPRVPLAGENEQLRPGGIFPQLRLTLPV